MPDSSECIYRGGDSKSSYLLFAITSKGDSGVTKTKFDVE